MKRDQSYTILSILILSIAIMLSGNVFAKKPPATPFYEIGKTGPAGGIVFYIADGGGSRFRAHHGLEAAPVDQGSNVGWGCYQTKLTGADGITVGTGSKNTIDILTGCTEPGIAAELAANYELNGYADWFLPSKEELNLMHRNLYPLGLGGLSEGHYYWSSTEVNIEQAWLLNVTHGSLHEEQKVDFSVRAIRAF